MEKEDGVLNAVEKQDLELLKNNPAEFWKGVKTIGNYAFSYLPLESIEIPDTITSVAAFAFCGCNKLKEVKIGKNVKLLGADAFYNCKKLEKVYIPGKVKEIGYSCFADCENLREVIMEEGIETIGHFAFANCSKLKTLHLANSVNTIYEYAFQYCKSLEKIEMPKNLLEIKNNLFYNCSNLKTVKLYPKTAKIGEMSFSGCENLRNINTENVKRIDVEAFEKCANLEKFEIAKNNFSIHESCINHSTFNYVYNSEANNTIVLLKDLPQVTEEKIYSLADFKKSVENFDNSIFLLQDFNVDKFYQFVKRTNRDGIYFPYKFLYNFAKNSPTTDFNSINYKRLMKEMPEFKDIVNYDTYEAKTSFLEFANALGCFSNVNFIDKNGNVTPTTFSQKASSLLAYIINKDILSITDIFKNFSNCYYIKPNQKFLEFLTVQGKKQLPNLNMLIKLNKTYPGMFIMAMSDFEKIKKSRASVDENGMPKDLSWEEAFKKAYSQTPYHGVTEETEDIARLFAKHNLTQEHFSIASELRRKANANNVVKHILNKPLKQSTFLEDIEKIAKGTNDKLLEIKSNLEKAYKKHFSFEMLDKHDARNAIIGIYTSCCATVTATVYGKDIAAASMTSNEIQNLVVKNERNEIIAKATMYVNKKHGYIVINSFEMNKEYREGETIEPGYYETTKETDNQKREEIFGAFMNGIHSFIKEYDKQNPNNPIKQVNVGMGYNRLKKQCNRFKGALEREMLSVPVNYSFDDTLVEQRILYKQNPNKKINSEIKNHKNDVEFN